jgi:PAS domain S-box-containing protein
MHDSGVHNKASKDLALMEARYRNLVEAAPDAMAVVDQNGSIIRVNNEMEKLFGYQPDELLGSKLEGLAPERYRHKKAEERDGSFADALVRQQGRMVGAEQAALHELVVEHGLRSLGMTTDHYGLRKDGSEFLVEMKLSPVESTEGTLVTVAVRDVTERKKALDAQQHLAAIMQASEDAIISEDLDGNITLWNRGAEQLFGYTPAEIIGRPASLLIPVAMREQEPLIDQIALKGGRVHHHDTVRVRKDGSFVDVDLAIAPMRNAAGKVIGASKFIHDISERKRREQESRRMEARFQRLLESAPDAMVIIDRDGVIQLANAQAERIFVYTKAELIGQPVVMLIPSNLLGTEEQQEAHLARDPGSRMMGHGIELEGQRKDGRGFPIEIALSPLEMEEGLHISVAIRDITDRKKAEHEIHELNRTLEQRVEARTNDLRISEKRYHNALDVLHEGVQIIGFDWTYLYVNDALVIQSTFSREELMGRTMPERYPGIEQGPMFATLQHCMEHRVSRIMDSEFTFPDGTLGTFLLSIHPVDEGLLILSTDITARKRAETELTIQREQLVRQNQDLEEFAFIASHDLKEPLRMVASYVQLLERRYSDKLDKDALEFIAFAVDGAARMKQLINDLLVYSQLGRAVKLEDVDLNTTIHQVQANLATLFVETGVTFTSTALPTVRSSATEMLQVFQNLIANAAKFRRDDTPPEIHVSAEAEGDYWLIRIGDNGIGIEEQYHDMVFAPFKRLHDKSKYSGSGIGLSVAQKIVLGNGGRIWFTSTVGVGTTFHLTLKRT